jgi:hypothetical protein
MALHKALDLADRFTTEQWRRHFWRNRGRISLELAKIYDRQGRREEADESFACVQDELDQTQEPGLEASLRAALAARPAPDDSGK